MNFFINKRLTFRQRLGNIIFDHDTVPAKIFDIILLLLISLSSLAIILETVPAIEIKYGHELRIVEFVVILLFSVEYFARIYSARKRFNYVFSLYGIIDFISIFPAYLSIFFPPLYYLVLFRVFRVFRVFRILKLVSFLKEELVLVRAMKKSFPKIIIFIGFILIVSVIFASLMYVIEGPSHGFSDIPTSLYWTIVTITTVGYGDITPLTGAGKVLASLIMLSGYGVIAVPTGIIFSEYNKASFHLKKK